VGVEQDVMERPDQDVLRRCELEQRHAQQRRPREVEAAAAIAFQVVVDGALLLLARLRPQVMPRHRDGDGSVHFLLRLGESFPAQAGAQHVVLFAEALPGSFERTEVERLVPTRNELLHVYPRVLVEKAMKEKTLLRRCQREQPRGTIRCCGKALHLPAEKQD
jgi:hypothetical protein